MLKQEEIDKLLDNLESIFTEEVSRYHFWCGGGSALNMVNVRTKSNTYTCKYQGDVNWITPKCETCIGLTADVMTLTYEQREKNRMVKNILAPIRHNWKETI